LGLRASPIYKRIKITRTRQLSETSPELDNYLKHKKGKVSKPWETGQFIIHVAG